jgi:hypothetical protein
MVAAHRGILVVPLRAVEQGKAVALLRDIVHPLETNAAASMELVLLAGIVVDRLVATQMEGNVAVTAGIARPVTNATLSMVIMPAVRMQDVRPM